MRKDESLKTKRSGQTRETRACWELESRPSTYSRLRFHRAEAAIIVSNKSLWSTFCKWQWMNSKVCRWVSLPYSLMSLDVQLARRGLDWDWDRRKYINSCTIRLTRKMKRKIYLNQSKGYFRKKRSLDGANERQKRGTFLKKNTLKSFHSLNFIMH